MRAPPSSSCFFTAGGRQRICKDQHYYHRKNNLFGVVLITILLLQCASFSYSDNKTEAEILMNFKQPLGHKKALKDWDPKKPPCAHGKPNWVGILCGDDDDDTVWGINLVNMGLFGDIDVDSLEELPNLRTVSLMNNKFNGTLPNFKKLDKLKSIYLSGNKFSGEIDDKAFEGMTELKKLSLDNNQFSGSIPSSLTTLKLLVELRLEGNKFSGEIPDFKLEKLTNFNVSGNQLKGAIPQGLSKINATSFSGNEDLCGPPLQNPCPAPPPPPTPPPAPPAPATPPPTMSPSSSSSSSSGLSAGTIVGIVAGVIVLLVVIAVIVIFVIRKRRNDEYEDDDDAPVPPQNVGRRAVTAAAAVAPARDLDNMEKGGGFNNNNNHQSSIATATATPTTTNKKGENGMRMTFLREDAERFELGDLLKASAEVLGSGHFGASYRAVLNSGKMMVVKRFRHMNNVGKEEFQEHMRRIGRLSHPNLLPVVAFYYRKEEKLLVAEYINNVNLAVHLHGNRSRGHASPDWAQRLNIIKGVAKGLQYLYSELPSLILPHGHLKSSNVLLTPSLEPLLTDYALVPVVNQEHAQDVMVAYKSPEYKHTNRVSKKTDVWSFGILILEILTGKFPSNFLHQGKGSETDLVNWVESIMNDEDWTVGDLFDKEMGEVPSTSEGQMMKLLKIGLSCADNDVEKRLDMKEAVRRIDEVKETDADDEEFFSIAATGPDFQK